MAVFSKEKCTKHELYKTEPDDGYILTLEIPRYSKVLSMKTYIWVGDKSR